MRPAIYQSLPEPPGATASVLSGAGRAAAHQELLRFHESQSMNIEQIVDFADISVLGAFY